MMPTPIKHQDILDKAKSYIWRKDPKPQIDTEGIEILHLLMGAILELHGALPPEQEKWHEAKREAVEEEKTIHMVKGQSRMGF